PPRAVDTSLMAGYVVIALDVGATRIKAALVAPDGSRRAELRRRTARADGPDAVLRQIADVAAEIAGHRDGLDLPARGIAVPGTVDPAGLVTAVNLGWQQVNVGDLISARLDIPVAVVNDAHAGAIGEGDLGAARGTRDYLYVSLGTGIGAAIV